MNQNDIRESRFIGVVNINLPVALWELRTYAGKDMLRWQHHVHQGLHFVQPDFEELLSCSLLVASVQLPAVYQQPN